MSCAHCFRILIPHSDEQSLSAAVRGSQTLRDLTLSIRSLPEGHLRARYKHLEASASAETADEQFDDTDAAYAWMSYDFSAAAGADGDGDGGGGGGGELKELPQPAHVAAKWESFRDDRNYCVVRRSEVEADRVRLFINDVENRFTGVSEWCVRRIESVREPCSLQRSSVASLCIVPTNCSVFRFVCTAVACGRGCSRWPSWTRPAPRPSHHPWSAAAPTMAASTPTSSSSAPCPDPMVRACVRACVRSVSVRACVRVDARLGLLE
jgi:hypothetical protein